MELRIAVPTDDGVSISQHFGQASYFKVILIENSQVSSSEMRAKASHQHGAHAHAEGTHPGQQMVETISDCQVLICGGMGTPVYDRAVAIGLKVFLTRLPSIDAAVQAYISGTLEHEPQRIHVH
jgi:predicted Fe-Mo cluster-binding NifX family protein